MIDHINELVKEWRIIQDAKEAKHKAALDRIRRLEEDEIKLRQLQKKLDKIQSEAMCHP